MDLITDVHEPEIKRIKSENECNERSCKREQNSDIQENVTDTSDAKEIFPVKREEDKEIFPREEDKERMEGDDKNAEIVDDDDEFQFPPDDDASDMLNEVEYNGYLPTVTDRYFTPYYKINVQSPGDDICIRIHSNRICMLSLAPSHVILQNDKDITKVNFKVSDKLDRSQNKVSGKGKHGAQPLQTNSNICSISCSDGQTYMIKCCMIGKLVEVNELLMENPRLLKNPPHKGGYLAIILQNLKFLDNLKQSLLTHEQYIELIKEREKTVADT
ncbi:protein Abitram [Nylanderia fulva]|uniref:protein Abitram n=1 Tax=Nylanderia fulva TaxID=613905 RepID=UPI0010FADA78|nr:protein Abitram [Nylanderia fulva]